MHWAMAAAWPREWVQIYPVLDGLPPPLHAGGRAELQELNVPAGTLLFEEQAPCQGFPLVLASEVRVAHGSPRAALAGGGGLPAPGRGFQAG
ncbi:MAG TPA: hypothetical protein PKB14_24520 [Rubrivivax sp.]|nr:hypothetical protein [Rubrivivax sp.]